MVQPSLDDVIEMGRKSRAELDLVDSAAFDIAQLSARGVHRQYLAIVVGGTMFSHGAQKLFGWFGGGGPRGTANSFEGLGFRPPLLLAILAGLGEVGGLAFAAGFVTPLAALGIATVMITAITPSLKASIRPLPMTRHDTILRDRPGSRGHQHELR